MDLYLKKWEFPSPIALNAKFGKIGQGVLEKWQFWKVCNDKTMYDRLQTNFDQKMSFK